MRARRFQWASEILRLGPERLIKQAVYEMYKDPQPGDLLMDAPKVESWKELTKYACNTNYWRTRVRALKQPKLTITGPQTETESTVKFTIS